MRQVVSLNESAPKKGLKLSIVKKEYCKPFVYPTPFELHFSPMYLQWFRDDSEGYIKRMKGTDKDLAAHFTIIKKYGVVLCGKKIEDVFGEVPKKDYVDSIWADVENAREEIKNSPAYMILNLCRVLAVLKEDLYLSKELGGQWGITHISEKYHSLILKALNWYKTDQVMHVDEALAKEFADKMITMILWEIEQLK